MSPLAAVVRVGHCVLDSLAVEILTGGFPIGNGPAANPGSFTSHSSHDKTLIFKLQPIGRKKIKFTLKALSLLRVTLT